MTLTRRWVRSWPAVLPLEERSYVVDDLPRLEIDCYDLASNPASWTVLRDCTLLEWDIIVSPQHMIDWEIHIDRLPDRVHVAPYPVYTGRGYTENEWMSLGDTTRAERFGFGMIWFPAAVVDAFHQAEHHPHTSRFTDGTFGAWYHAAYGPARVHPDVRPVHLNYRVALPSAAPDQG